MNRFIPLL